MSDDQYIPLSKQYADDIKGLNQLETSSLRKDSTKYQELCNEVGNKLTELKKRIQQLALFSDNEDLEELQTTQIQYLNIDYYLARFHELNGGGGGGSSGGDMINKRRTNLKISKNLYLQFLHNLENYKILNKDQLQKIDNFQNSFNPTLSEIRPNDATKRREEKIANYKYEQTLSRKLEILQKNSDEELEKLDDEMVREIYVDQLKYHSVKAFQNIESIIMELELLANFPTAPVPQQHRIESNDDRMQVPSSENDYLYTDKLETLTTPLLSKTGKILRPFTIVNDRNQLKRKVYGTGQVLPSMTVDEFLQQELENGGMVKPQEEEPELDEDNNDQMDQETYKQREWDEFKELNAKGSGNTINRG